MKVLIAEDDKLIREGLREVLVGEGYEVVEAESGARALALYQQTKPDFVLLDIMMPEMDGYAVCREIRKLDIETPVIFVSAKSEEIDKVLGLELGADDFIMKPFGTREVIARMRAVARRVLAGPAKNESDTDQFEIDDLIVSPKELCARRNGQVIELSLRDIKILKLFCENQGEVITRDRLFDAAWGRNYVASSRSLDQHLSKLRKRVEKDAVNPTIITTVHGVGYRFPESQ